MKVICNSILISFSSLSTFLTRKGIPRILIVFFLPRPTCPVGRTVFPRPRCDRPGSWQGKETEPFQSREWFLDQCSQAVMTVESDNETQVGKVLSQVFSWERKGPCLNLFCGFREISSDPYMIVPWGPHL